MNQILKKIRSLQKEKLLARVLIYKFFVHTGIGRFLSFRSRGVRLGLHPSEMTYEAWKTPRNYRSADGEFLEKVLEPGGLVVDVGANIGMISIQSAKLVGPAGRVIAIEPNPRIISYCKKNIVLNGLENITPIQTAMGSEEGSVLFNCDDCDDRSRVVSEGGIRVPLTTLDKIMEREPNRKIHLLKIDVEGFELSVLEGARESLKRTQWLYIEVESQNYSQYGKKAQDVMTILDESGFDAFFCDEKGNWKQINGAVPQNINLIGKKRDASAMKEKSQVSQRA